MPQHRPFQFIVENVENFQSLNDSFNMNSRRRHLSITDCFSFRVLRFVQNWWSAELHTCMDLEMIILLLDYFMTEQIPLDEDSF